MRGAGLRPRAAHFCAAVGRRWRAGLLAGLGIGLGLGSGCAVPVQSVCRSCARLVIGERPPVAPGTRTVFLLVPGLLGYGWEWNGAQVALAQLPQAATIVYEWDPWTSIRAGGAQLALSTQYLLRRLPRSVSRVVVVGHSAAGLLAVAAAATLRPPPGVAVEVMAIGAPLAGNYFNLLGGEDNFSTPIPLALAGKLNHWPEPAPGVELRIWPTGASDPVMKPRFGHDPADPRVLPRASIVQKLPPSLDHNVALATVARQLVAALRGEPAAGAPLADLAAAGGSAAAPPKARATSAEAAPPASGAAPAATGETGGAATPGASGARTEAATPAKLTARAGAVVRAEPATPGEAVASSAVGAARGEPAAAQN